MEISLTYERSYRTSYIGLTIGIGLTAIAGLPSAVYVCDVLLLLLLLVSQSKIAND